MQKDEEEVDARGEVVVETRGLRRKSPDEKKKLREQWMAVQP